MKKVLVIDDEDDLRRMLRLMLEPRGYQVSEAENGLEGIAQYGRDPADVVLLDLFMPQKDGIETLRDLRKIDARARVIAMSGGGSHGHVSILKTASLMGAAKVMLKPFTRAQLLEALSEVLAPPARSDGAESPSGNPPGCT